MPASENDGQAYSQRPDELRDRTVFLHELVEKRLVVMGEELAHVAWIVQGVIACRVRLNKSRDEPAITEAGGGPGRLSIGVRTK